MTVFTYNATTLEEKIRSSRPAWATSDLASNKSRPMRMPQTHTFMLLVSVFLIPDRLPHPWQVS